MKKKCSTDYKWDLERNEITIEMFDRFDVKLAKQILQNCPHEIVEMEIDEKRDSIKSYLEEVRFKNDIDWDIVDPEFPLIFIQLDGEKIPIDGRHRLKKAFEDPLCRTLNVVYLTEAESEQVKIK